jgi:polar amino acid transport system substrate-binding protein
MKNSKLLSLSVILFLSLVLGACSKKITTDQYDTIQNRGYIIVGLDDTFAPMGFRNNENELVGFDVDLAKAVFAEMNMDVQFQPIDWSMKETELNNGNIDLIWNGYTITDERKEKVTFSDPYLNNRQVIVVMKDSNIVTKSQLANQIVGAQAGSSSVDALNREKSVLNTFSELATYETNSDAFIELEAGRIDALVVDEILARYYISLKGENNYTVLNDDFGSEEYGVGFRKTDVTLIEAFNEAFNTIKTNGKAAEISELYFAENIVK